MQTTINSSKLKTIADVLWYAANCNLAEGDNAQGDYYSCNAVATTCDGTLARDADPTDEMCRMTRLLRATEIFLCELGVNCDSAREFEEFEVRGARGYKVFTHEAQGARYLWLMFAHMLALEEGK